MLINDAHIWVAHFESEDALEQYMEETYDEDNDDAPISQFAADQGQAFYDHDLVYAQFHDSPTARVLVEGWGFPEESVATVVQAIVELNAPNANVCFVADKDEFDQPCSIKGNGYELWYVGQFDGCSM